MAMQTVLKAIAIVAFAAGLALPVRAADIESGFLGTKWGTQAQELKGFTRVGGKGKFAYYVDPQRKYTFFGNEVPERDVVYGCYEDRLFAVYADIEGIDVFSQIKSHIQRKYGVPTKTSRETRGDLTAYVWRLKQSQIKFKHHETSGKMKIALYYLPIAKQANAEMLKNLEAEPPGPFFSPLPFSSYDGPIPMFEFMDF
jgi:hypothetical protein